MIIYEKEAEFNCFYYRKNLIMIDHIGFSDILYEYKYLNNAY